MNWLWRLHFILLEMHYFCDFALHIACCRLVCCRCIFLNYTYMYIYPDHIKSHQLLGTVANKITWLTRSYISIVYQIHIHYYNLYCISSEPRHAFQYIFVSYYLLPICLSRVYPTVRRFFIGFVLCRTTKL